VQDGEIDNTTTFEIRDLHFRAKRAGNYLLSAVGPLSFHSATWGDAKVVLFGGGLQGSVTSAVFYYDPAAPMPALGLTSLVVAADSPQARGYAGLVQLDSLSLLMFGGVKPRAPLSSCLEGRGGCCAASSVGIWDTWLLDLSNQAWRLLSEDSSSQVDDSLTVAMAFGAFSSMSLDHNNYILVHGGFSCGFVPGLSLDDTVCEPPELCPGRLTSTIQLVSITAAGRRPVRYRQRSTASAGPPSARSFHSAQGGSFASGIASTLVYGGLDSGGRALMDLWSIETGSAVPAYAIPFKTSLNGSIGDSAGWELLFASVFTATSGCPSAASDAIAVEIQMASNASLSATVKVFAPRDILLSCVLPLLVSPTALAAAVANASLAPEPVLDAASVAAALQFTGGGMHNFAMPVAEVRFDVNKYDTRSAADGCKKSKFLSLPLLT
jgi:hypothetical protein